MASIASSLACFQFHRIGGSGSGSGPGFSGCKRRLSSRCQGPVWIHAKHDKSVSYQGIFPARKNVVCKAKSVEDTEDGSVSRTTLQLVLWSATGFYVFWLFILPYAPGDPAWAINQETVSMLLSLSLNFFFLLPLANAAGFQLVSASVIHPTAEALFNVVMGWTLLFGPMLFSDGRNNRFKGRLEALWLGQWLLTSAFLLPYMAIRLNRHMSPEAPPPSKLSQWILSAAKPIALTGASVGVLSIAWGWKGRPEAGFGDLVNRWNFFVQYIGRDRVAYAFLWDLCLYSLFQTWLIQSNLKKVDGLQMQRLVSILSYVPYVGSVAYLWGLAKSGEEVENQEREMREET